MRPASVGDRYLELAVSIVEYSYEKIARIDRGRHGRKAAPLSGSYFKPKRRHQLSLQPTLDAIKQHGANQTSGLGRNALTVFSPSIPPNRIAPRVGANPEQSATSAVSLERADRHDLEASAILILVLDGLLFPSSDAPRLKCHVARTAVILDPTRAQSRECRDDLSPSSSRDPLCNRVQFYRPSPLSFSSSLCASRRGSSLAKGSARLTEGRSLLENFRRISSRFDSIQNVGARSG